MRGEGRSGEGHRQGGSVRWEGGRRDEGKGLYSNWAI